MQISQSEMNSKDIKKLCLSIAKSEDGKEVIKLLKKQASEFNAQLIVITHDNRLKKHFKKSIKL